MARIADAHPSADTVLVDLDLADLATVTRAAKVVAQEPRLDVLINNAGIMMNPKTLTKDGFESQFGVNHLGHFALTGLLLPKLEATPDSRIVVVSSVGHRRGEIHFDDIDADQSYSPQRRYYQSKLANLLHTYELDRRLRAKGSSTIAVAVHPGGADTELPRYLTGFYGRLARLLMPLLRPIANSAETGAWPTLLGATAAGAEAASTSAPAGSAKHPGRPNRSTQPKRARTPLSPNGCGTSRST